MLFFRVLQHLLPDAAAWQITIAKTLRRFFEGLVGTPTAAVLFVDQVYEDIHPDTTREVAEWEKQFGLTPLDPDDDTARRAALSAEWKANGGQSPHYIESVLQEAGFEVYVHEWWDPDTEATRDPRDYIVQPLIGLYQCTGEDPPGTPLPSQPQCSAFASQPQCNGFLANETFYLVNKDLTRRPPPRVPDDPETWPYFLYIGGEEFPELAVVDSARRAEFERLILKIRPTQNWIVLRVSYTDDEESLLLTEGGDPLVTEGEDFLEA